MPSDFPDSILRPESYRRFAAENAASTARYAAFLSLLFIGGLGIAVKLRLAPVLAGTFTWLETSMPPLTLAAGGGVTSTTPGPLRLENPGVKEIALMIDTARKEPVTLDQMKKAKVVAYLTGGALYLDRGQNPVMTIDLSKSVSDRDRTVDTRTYKEWHRWFDWVFYPALLIAFFLLFAITLAVSALAYALAGLIFASLAGGRLEYAALLRMAIHAQSAGTLLWAVDTALPWTIPGFEVASAASSLLCLWLGVRAAVQAVPGRPAA